MKHMKILGLAITALLIATSAFGQVMHPPGPMYLMTSCLGFLEVAIAVAMAILMHSISVRVGQKYFKPVIGYFFLLGVIVLAFTVPNMPQPESANWAIEMLVHLGKCIAAILAAAAVPVAMLLAIALVVERRAARLDSNAKIANVIQIRR